ncbi:hypothetical protein [Mycobacterium kubicae]|uniref:hypothetical protein n=1 Tax=Mycobacterium kubicae TaxID=120959 RepID=UPI00164078C6|nr:hypothetical protein [Mycobacterium kubicae]
MESHPGLAWSARRRGRQRTVSGRGGAVLSLRNLLDDSTALGLGASPTGSW